MAGVPEIAADAVLVKSEQMPESSEVVRGYDFNEGVNYHKLFSSMSRTGFQATSVGQAITEINRMIDCKFQEIPSDKRTEVNLNPCGRELTNCTIFLSYTSNLISAGTREIIRYLVQHNMGTKWTPSKVVARLGKEIDNPDSVYYWAYKNNIPVFCPALTDGSLGDMIYFHSYQTPGLVIDIVEDIRLMNSQAVYAVNTGMVILGGGIIKHHTCNANLMRNGADFSVFVNTACEFDGSDAGAKPDEAVSWGKIKLTAKPVKVYGEATVIFPILVGETFASRQKEFQAFYSK
uniref:Deoxyhypusine synthase n=1 Tax=Biomphalaria glabrata TaxID=6526 RepID=A0A2C9JE45_BIOGL